MEPSSFLEHIERLRAQNQNEPDRALRRENSRTIKHLYKQYRKATRHRPPWFAFVRITLSLLLVFVIVEFAFLGFVKGYGWGNTFLVAFLTAIIFVLVTVTVMVTRKLVPPEIYEGVVQRCFDALRALKGREGKSSKTTPEIQKPSTSTPPKELNAKNQSAPQVSFDNEPPVFPAPTDDVE